MARRIDHVLHDMLQAIGYAVESAAGKNVSDFETDWKFRLTFERALEILSEASRSLPKAQKAIHPEIDWLGLQDLGNILRHRYDSVSGHVLLQIVEEQLPSLQRALIDIKNKRNNDGQK